MPPLGSLGRVLVLAIAFVALIPRVATAKKHRAARTGVARAGAARTAAKRLVVLSSQGVGPEDTALNAKLVQVLGQHKIQVVTGARVQKSIRKDGAPASEADWTKLAAKLKVDGFVDFTASQDGAKRSVDVVVRNGADGSVAGQETFTAKGPPKRLAAALGVSFWKKLGTAVQQTSRPSKGEESTGLAARDLPPSSRSEPSVAKTEGATSSEAAKATKQAAEPHAEEANADKGTANEEAEEKTEAPERPVAALPAVEVEVDLRALQHLFEYVPASAAQNYPLGFTPIVGGHASWYPLRLFGIFAQGEISAGLSTAAVSTSFPTSTREFVVGAQFRMPFSFGQLGASAGYFQHAFLIQDTADPNDASRLLLSVPNTVYVGARLAVNARFRIGNRVQVGVEGAYRVVTSAGNGIGQVQSNQYFPMSAAPVAVDGNAFVGFRLGSQFELRGGFDYRRYAYQRLQGMTFAGAAINAPGALDQYVVVFLGAAGVFGR